MRLEGFYTDERSGELINALIEGKITKAEYFLHESEYSKEEYIDFCKTNHYDPLKPEVGELFWLEKEKEEKMIYGDEVI